METGLETGSEIPQVPIGEPQFDQEWTLQKARPVVPFQTIETEKHRRLALKLAAAFAVAVILGAVTALVSVRLRQNPSLQTEATVAIADDQPAEPEIDNSDNQISGTDEEVTELDDQPVVENEAPVASPSSSKSPDRRDKPVHEVLTNQEPEPEINTASRRQPILVDHWEERRLRRVIRDGSVHSSSRNRLERRERRSQRNRDLMRIDELFEGQHPR